MADNTKRKIWFFLVLLVSVILLLFADHLGFFAGMDRYFYDMYFRIRGERSVSGRITVIAIDEKSLKAFGPWPIKRRLYAEMLDRLDKATAVGFDILLMEPTEDDGFLEESIKRNGRVVLPEYISDALEAVVPIKSLTPFGMGHVHLEPGVDNTVREVFHTLYSRGVMVPSITSAINDILPEGGFVRQRPIQIRKSDSGEEIITQADQRKINYYGPPGSFEQVSLVDVVSGKLPRDFFSNRIVLVGLTAPGIVEDISTPFSHERRGMPGVEVHANILNNLLDGSSIRDISGRLRAVIAILISLALGVVFLRINERNAALLWAFALFAIAAASYLLFSKVNLWFYPTAFYVSFFLVFVISYLYRLDSAARKLDHEYEFMTSLPGWDEEAAPAPSTSSGLLGFLSEGGINWKIRRQTRLTRKLLDLNKQLETALKTERESLDHQVRLVEMLSHEYRTPLAIIRANLDILEMKDEASGGISSTNFGKMKRAVSRLVEVMEVSLGRERLEDTGKRIERKEIRLGPFMRDLMVESRGLWTERFFDLDIKDDDVCIIHGDGSMLKTALLNLIDNAVKYSAEGEAIRVSLCRSEGEVVIRVRNKGARLPEIDQERAFEKFYRGSGSANTLGAGLGLYLVRRIVEQHGGSVDLSCDDAGSTVATVRLQAMG